MIDPAAIAREIVTARANREPIAVLPSARGLDLPTAYAVEAELSRRQVAAGHRVVGVKAGYANKAVWRALKLETLAWASMYDDTVALAAGGDGTLAAGRMFAPKIEPEVVVRLAAPLPAGLTDPVEVLRHVEWLALGFEVIDSPVRRRQVPAGRLRRRLRPARGAGRRRALPPVRGHPGDAGRTARRVPRRAGA